MTRSEKISDVIRLEAYTACLTALAKERLDMRSGLISVIQEGERQLSVALERLDATYSD